MENRLAVSGIQSSFGADDLFERTPVILFKSQRGQSVIQVLIAIGLMGIVMATMASMFQVFAKQQNQSNLAFHAGITRNDLISALNNPTAWRNTVSDASNNFASGVMLDCQVNSAPCTTDETTDVPAGGTPIGYVSGTPSTGGVMIQKVFDSSNVPVLDASSPSNGFTSQGNTCSTFNAAPGAGDDACPLRFEVHWWAKCKCTNANCNPATPTDTCKNAQPQLQVIAIYNPKTQGYPFNPSNYGTPKFLQGQDPGGVCWQLAGANLFETCATNVGIGTSTPSNRIDSVADAGANPFRGTEYSNYVIWGSGLILRRARGTAGAPSSVLANDVLGGIYGAGYATSDFSDNITGWGGMAAVALTAKENWSDTTMGEGIDFITTPNGTAARQTSMTLDSFGNLGIGIISPLYKLDVTGALGSTVARFSDGMKTCSITPSVAGSITCASDARLKKDITPLSDADSLENVLRLKAVTYHWKTGDDKLHTGYIAQEVEKVAPEFVVTGQDGLKQVSYVGFIPWITGAIKAIYAKVTKLEDQNAAARIQALERENTALKIRLEQQIKDLAAIKQKLGM